MGASEAGIRMAKAARKASRATDATNAFFFLRKAFPPIGLAPLSTSSPVAAVPPRRRATTKSDDIVALMISCILSLFPYSPRWGSLD